MPELDKVASYWTFPRLNIVVAFTEHVYWGQDQTGKVIYGTRHKRFPDIFQFIPYGDFSFEIEEMFFKYILKEGLIKHMVSYNA